MKYLLALSITFCSFFLNAQEKGLTPVTANGQPKTGDTYAVVVGISDYQDKDIPDLRFADKDAEAFAAFLQSPAGGSLDGDHLKVLLNEKATAAQFAIALDWLWEVVKENDRVIIYFSGHGDVERKSITQPGYLLCWDAPSRVYMAGGAFNVRDLNDVVSTLSIQNKGKVILITDACRAGKLSGSSIGGSQATAANLAKQFANEIKILSCQPDEYSIEGEQWGGGRGAFSYHLLDGLSGMADGNADQSVNLKEIGRYLEDYVTEEVAPQSQNPVVVGNKTEKLTDVFPEILAQLKEGKRGQLQLFTSTESRGIEDEVLAAADSNIVEMYFAFQKAIDEKQFLEPADACADFYYEKLSQEPQLEKLHSSMRRNYAAALQDDAQQMMNNWLKGDIDELALSKKNQERKYRPYPLYLEKAAELLGEFHYMFPILKARNLYFEAYLMHVNSRNADKELGEKILSKYKEALQWQPNAAQIYLGMMNVHYLQMQQLDSAEFYARRATEFAPSWYLPYSALGWLYSEVRTNLEKSRYYFELVDKVDSSAVKTNLSHMLNLAVFYLKDNQLEASEALNKKAIQIDSTVASFHHNLGIVYQDMKRFSKAEKCYKKAIQLDSTNHLTYDNLGNLYKDMKRFSEAEEQHRKAIQIDSTYGTAYNNLGALFLEVNNFEKAEQVLSKAIQIDSANWIAFSNLGLMYQAQQRWEEGALMTRKAVEIFPRDGGLYAELAYALSFIPDRVKESEIDFDKAKKLNPEWPDTYLYLAQYTLRTGNKSTAYDYLQKAFEKGVGKNGVLNFEDLNIRKDFEILRKEPLWNDLMQKHFPNQYKSSNE